MTELLRTTRLSRSFRATRAVDGVDLAVTAGSRHALIGPNGAGKSTLFRLVTGALHPSSGSVWFDGRDVTGTAEHRRARLGMSQTLQHSSLFPSMTVAQNVALAAQRRWGHPWLPVPHRGRWQDRVGRLLSDVGLEDRAGDPMAALSYGECRQLEVAVALATEPRLLLLDEPAAGMSPDETTRLSALLRRLPAETTLLFVEHDLDLVFDLATQVTALHLGQVLMSGDPDQVRENALVQEAYLGAGARGDLFLEPIAESDDVSPGV